MLHRQTVCWEAEGKVRRGRVRGLWCSCGQSSTASTSRWFLHWTRSRLHRWSVPQSQRDLTCQNNTRLCYLLTERTAVCRRHNDLQMYIYTRAFLLKSLFNPLTGTFKPQSNGPLYSNTVTGTLAIDGWTVTFGTARRGLGWLPTLASTECTVHFIIIIIVLVFWAEKSIFL